VVFPLDGALDLSFKVSGEPSWDERHFDVLVRVRLQLSRHGLELQVISAHKPRFLKFKFKLLRLVEVVEDDESVTDLVSFELSEVDTFIREGCHLSLLSDVCSTFRQILVELNLFGLLVLLFWVVALSSQFQDVRMWAWSFDIANLDRKVNCVLLGFQRSEQRVNVLSIVGSQRALRVLDFKNSKLEVIGVQSFKLRSIDLVLQLCNT